MTRFAAYTDVSAAAADLEARFAAVTAQIDALEPSGATTLLAHSFAGQYASDKIRAAFTSVLTAGVLTGPIIMDCRGLSGSTQYLTSAITGALATTERMPVTFLWGPHTFYVSALQFAHSHHRHVFDQTTFIQKDTSGARVTGSHLFYVRAQGVVAAVTDGGTSVTFAASTIATDWIEAGSCLGIFGHIPRTAKDNGTLAVAMASAVSTVLTIDATLYAALPSSGYLRIEDEIVRYSAKAGANTLTVQTRGYGGTTAVSHLISTPVYRCVYETYRIASYNSATRVATLHADDGTPDFTATAIDCQVGSLGVDFAGTATFDGNMDTTTDDSGNPMGISGEFSRLVTVSPTITFQNWDHGGMTWAASMDVTAEGRFIDNGRAASVLGAHLWFFRNCKRCYGVVHYARGGYGIGMMDSRTTTPTLFDNNCVQCTILVKRAENCARGVEIESGVDCRAVIEQAQSFATNLWHVSLSTGTQWVTNAAPTGCYVETNVGDAPSGGYHVNVSALSGGNTVVVRNKRSLFGGTPLTEQKGNSLFGKKGRVENTGTGAVQANCADQDYQYISASGNITWSVPLNPYIGAELTFETLNNTGGAITVTPNAVFKTDGSTLNPGAGKTRIAKFRYNGTNWMQQGPVTADIT